jgi:uncharacterized protein
VGCRVVISKRELIRLVRRPEGVLIDPTGKASGRGAYLHHRRSCWERGLKGPLAHALKTTLTDQDLERLKTYQATLPEDNADDQAELASQSQAL